MRWQMKSKHDESTGESFKTRKIVFIMIISIVTIIIIGTISGYLYIQSALKPANPNSDEEIEVVIPIGSSPAEIGNILEEKKIIKDGRVFRFYTKYKKNRALKLVSIYLIHP